MTNRKMTNREDAHAGEEAQAVQKVDMPTLSKSRRWASLLVLLLAQFVLSIDLTIMDIALPSITQEIRPTSDQQLWIVDVYSLILAGLLVPASSLSDRFGRKRFLLLGSLVFCIASALVLLASNAAEVIAVRGIMGVAAAMIMPTTISTLRNVFTDAKERAAALAAWSVIGGAGMALGPLIGGFLLEHFSWHSAFLVNIPLMGVAFVLGVFVLPEIRVRNLGKWDVLGAVMAFAGMVLTLWSVKRMAATMSVSDPVVLCALVVGVVLLIAFVRRCLHSDTPLLDVTLFKDRSFTAGILAALSAMFAMAGVLLMLSQWFQLVNGYTPLEAGIRTLPMAIASIIGGAVFPAAGIRFGARPTMVFGIAIAGVAMVATVLLRGNLTYPAVATVMALVGLGTGALSVGSAVIMGATPPEKASSGAAFEEIAYDLGNVLGVAIVGSIASIIYRQGFSVNYLRSLGLDDASIKTAMDSYGGAVSVAQQTGVQELINEGAPAFTDALSWAIVVGGVILIVVAVVIHRLVPKGLSIAED